MRAMKLWVFWLLTIGFRLGIWLLLTSDTSQFNLFVGLLLAVALPRLPGHRGSTGASAGPGLEGDHGPARSLWGGDSDAQPTPWP